MTHITIPTILDRLEAGDATGDEVLAALNVRAAMKQAMKEVDARFEAGVTAWIEANGPLESNGVRYYVGVQKDTKCVDQTETLRTLLETGGPEAVGRCLASGAFKHGACREALGDEWDKHFTVTERVDLKEGKPVRKLHTVDEKFLK